MTRSSAPMDPNSLKPKKKEKRNRKGKRSQYICGENETDHCAESCILVQARFVKLFTFLYYDKKMVLWLLWKMQESAGVMHLKNLADAGLTHVHLLPCFDFATVNEQKDTWKTVGEDIFHSYFLFSILKLLIILLFSTLD